MIGRLRLGGKVSPQRHKEHKARHQEKERVEEEEAAGKGPALPLLPFALFFVSSLVLFVPLW
jgi:hypothetical protein